MFLGFPDMKWTVDEQIAEGEKVVSRFTWTGTHKGEFMGIPPTNKKVKVWGVVIDVIRNGLFSESRIIMDSVGLLQQLGVMPQPPEE
jgi:predicted ester cyclase